MTIGRPFLVAKAPELGRGAYSRRLKRMNGSVPMHLRSLERYNCRVGWIQAQKEGVMPDSERGRSTKEPHRGLPDDTRQHLQAARQAFRESIDAFLPAGFVENRRIVRREALLAARSLIDHALERLEGRSGD